MKKTVLIIFLTLIISCKSIDNKNPNIVLFFVDDLGGQIYLLWVQSIMKLQILIIFQKVE